MIEDKHRWLLRGVETCFDHLPESFSCRVCRTKGKGDVRVLKTALRRHLAAHRAEHLVRNEPHDEFLETVA